MPAAPYLEQGTNGIWSVHWTEPGPHGKRGRSKRISTRQRNLEAAKAFLGRWLLMEREAPAADKAYTVADLWSVYYARHVERKVVATERLDFAWKNLQPHFGALKPVQITDETTDDYLTLRKKGAIGRPANNATVRRELNALLACLNWCAHAKRRIILPESVPAIELPPHGDARARWLTIEEVKALMEAAREMRRVELDRLSRVERFLWLALETAARKGAIQELTWDRVDFTSGVIHYDVPGRIRTKKRRATVPISPALRPVLERAFNERQEKHVLDHDGDVLKAVWRAAERAGIEDVSPHVLRHTAATHMLRNGVSIWTVAGVLGNSVQQVEETYGHHIPAGLREGVANISAGLLEMGE